MFKTTKLKVHIRLLEDLWGTIPKDKDVFKTYIESKKPEDQKEDEAVDLEKLEEKGFTGFHTDEKGVFLYDYLIRGFLKNAANTLKENMKVKNMRSKIVSYVFVHPRKIHLGKKKPDGVVERPLRAQTMQGPRVTLARSEYVKAGVELKFEIEIIENPAIKVEQIKELLEYGKYQGLGQNRGAGYGAFEVVSIKQQ